MSKILDFANNVSLGREALIRRSVSNGGYYRSERGGPTLYSMEVNLPLLTLSQYKEVEAELIGIDDGIETIVTNVTERIRLTTPSTIRPTQTVPGTDDIITVVGQQSGNTLQLNNVMTAPSVGDWIQPISGSIDNTYTKVYQIKSVGDIDSGNLLTVTLNTGLMNTVAGGSVVRFGNDVEFKFSLQGRPDVTVVPQNAESNLYLYGTFNFNEVVENN